jgi:hypothetical protein
MNEPGICALRPTPRRRVDLVGEDADGRGDQDVLRGKKRQLAFPIETRGRDRRVRQPVEGDIVEDVVSRLLDDGIYGRNLVRLRGHTSHCRRVYTRRESASEE